MAPHGLCVKWDCNMRLLYVAGGAEMAQDAADKDNFLSLCYLMDIFMVSAEKKSKNFFSLKPLELVLGVQQYHQLRQVSDFVLVMWR